MPNGHFAHVVLPKISRTEVFSRPGTGGKKRFPSRVADRQAHAEKLLQQLQASRQSAQPALDRRSQILTEDQNGFYLKIESRAGEPLRTERLERRQKNIELLAVKEEGDRTTATIFVPTSADEFFANAIEDYRTKNEPRAKEPEAKG